MSWVKINLESSAHCELLKIIDDLDFIEEVRLEVDKLFEGAQWHSIMEKIDKFEVERAQSLEKA